MSRVDVGTARELCDAEEERSGSHDTYVDVEKDANQQGLAPQGCRIRFTRITKVVEVKELSKGLLRGSISNAKKSSNNDKAKTSKSRAKTKCILNEVSGEARPGEVVALMGPSGSGKTSLLDALSGRSSYDSGTVTLDGRPSNSSSLKQLKRKIAYIKQSDIFFQHLTVRDQLIYTALLRLPSRHRNRSNRNKIVGMSREEKIAEVDHILSTLRLTKCADTPIRLISGGERKRVNIGTELLTNPSVIMLDEPTSGLDSTSAVALIAMLTELAVTQNKTIISSIHQPNSAVFKRFDNVLMLADGCVVYFGSPLASLDYLEARGYPCPKHSNPADHWMDLLVVDSIIESTATTRQSSFCDTDLNIVENCNENSTNQFESEVPSTEVNADGDIDISNKVTDIFNQKRASMRKRSSAVVLSRRQRTASASGSAPKARLIKSWDNEALSSRLESSAENDVAGMNLNSIDEATYHKFNTSWLTQFWVLTHRCMKNSRSAIFTPLNVMKSICLGTMVGLLWFRMPYTEKTTVDRSSYFFFSMTYWVFDSMFAALHTFPNERKIIFKERASGSYHLSAYFFAKTISEAPTRLSLPTFYITISFWMANANPSFAIFVGSLFCCLLSVMAGESLGLMIGAAVMDFEKAMTIMVVFALSLMVAGGYYISNIPTFISWIKYLSPFNYAYNASSQMAFDQPVPCDGSGVLASFCDSEDSNGFVTPEEIRSFLGLSGSVAFNTGCLVLVFFIPRYFAFLFLKRKKGSAR